MLRDSDGNDISVSWHNYGSSKLSDSISRGKNQSDMKLNNILSGAKTDFEKVYSLTPLETPLPAEDIQDSHGTLARRKAISIKEKERKSYTTLCLLYVIYGISYSLLIPALPGLTLKLTAGDTGRSSMLYGTATSIRYALEFFSAPLLGSLADVKGRKFVFVLAFGVCALELMLLTFYPSIQMIFITRAMSGLGDAGVAAAYAMMTDMAMHNQDIVTQQYGLLGAMTGLAFIIGPYLGGRLMELDMNFCFLAAAVIAIFGGILSFFFLEETKPMLEQAEVDGIVGQVGCDDEENQEMGKDQRIRCIPSCQVCWNFNPLDGLKSHLTNPSLRVLLLPLSLSAVNLGIPFIWYMYMHHTFQATSSQIGLFLSFHGLMNAIAQGLFIRLIIPRILSERNAAIYGLLVVALHTVCYGLCQETWQLFVVALMFCLSIIHYPALKAIVVCESLECRNEIQFQANLQGAISSIRTASIACGSMLFTSLFSYGISLEPVHLPQLPFLVAGAIYVVAFFALVSALRSIDNRRSCSIECYHSSDHNKQEVDGSHHVAESRSIVINKIQNLSERTHGYQYELVQLKTSEK